MSAALPDLASVPVLSRRLGSWRFSIEREAFSMPQLASSYDAIADRWHRKIVRLGMPAAYQAVLQPVAQALEATASPRVLDCGIGTGALSEALVRAARFGIALEGLDISPRMVEQADARLRAAGIEPMLRTGDVTCLPFEAARFDLTMAAHVLEHLPNPAAALAEMVRVTKPGGSVVLLATRRSFGGFWIHLNWRTQLLSTRRIERLMHDSGLTDIAALSGTGTGSFSALSVAFAATKPR